MILVCRISPLSPRGRSSCPINHYSGKAKRGMIFHKKRAVMLFLSLVALAFLCSGVFWASSGHAAETLKLTILHVNDPHAHFLPYTEKEGEGLIGGFAKAAKVISDIEARDRKEGRHTLLFLAGDLLMGTPFSSAFKGKLGVRLMNEMKFTAMAVGNHEFDYGQENLFQELKPLMQFPLLSANIRNQAGEYVFERAVTKELANPRTRVVIFGLTTTDTPVTTHPNNIKGLVFDDPIETAQSILKDYSENDLVIAVTHLGFELDKKLAEACPKIDVIVGGHSHTAVKRPVKVRDTIICQAGAYARSVGEVSLDVVDGKVIGFGGGLIMLGPEAPEDPRIAAIIAEHKALLDAKLNEVVGKNDVFLEGTRSVIRSGAETELGRLLGYIMALNAKTDAAFINGGSIRAGLNKGDISLGDVYTVLPFRGTLIRTDLSGKDLEAVLQKSADLPQGSGGKLQVFGVSFKNEGGRVKIEKVRGRDFDPTKTYSVAINDFLLAGGDGYTMFQTEGKNTCDTGLMVSDLVVDFIKEEKVITPDLLAGLK